MPQRLEKSHGRQGSRLWIPNRIVNLVPPDTYFDPELTEEGILFRRVGRPKVSSLPSWTIQPPDEDMSDVMLEAMAVRLRSGSSQTDNHDSPGLDGHGPGYD